MEGKPQSKRKSNIPTSEDLNLAKVRAKKKEKAQRNLLLKLRQELEAGGISCGPTRTKQPREPEKTLTQRKMTWNTRVLCWGSGSLGQLGVGDENYRLTPECITAFDVNSVHQAPKSIYCGDTCSLMVAESGAVYTWGTGPLGHHTVKQTHFKYPKQVQALSNVRIISASIGSEHAVALSDRGSVYSWGNATHGRLGHGNLNNVVIPTRIRALAYVRISQVACGQEHTLALETSGTIFAFGSNKAGQLGLGDFNGRLHPTEVPEFNTSGAVRIACGMNHSGVITRDGMVYTFGWGEHGRLGHGDEDLRSSPTMIDILQTIRAVDISCGGAHSMVLSSKHKVFSFGWGAFGQLGTAQVSNSILPKCIKFLSNKNITKIACGYCHSAAASSKGQLYMWGFGEEAQIGNGTEVDQLSPLEIELEPPNNHAMQYITAIALGKAHSLVVLSADSKQMLQHKRRLLQAAIRIQFFLRKWLVKIRQRKDKLHAVLASQKAPEVFIGAPASRLVQQSGLNIASPEDVLKERIQQKKKEEAKILRLRELAAKKERARKLEHKSAMLIQTQFRQVQQRQLLTSHLRRIIKQERERQLAQHREAKELQQMHLHDRESRQQEVFHQQCRSLIIAIANEWSLSVIQDTVSEYGNEKAVLWQKQMLEEKLERQQAAALKRKQEEEERQKQREEAKQRRMIKEQQRRNLADLEIALRERREMGVCDRESYKFRKYLILQKEQEALERRKAKLAARAAALEKRRGAAIAERFRQAEIRRTEREQKSKLKQQQKHEQLQQEQDNQLRKEKKFRQKIYREAMNGIKSTSRTLMKRTSTPKKFQLLRKVPSYKVLPGQEQPNYVLDPHYYRPNRINIGSPEQMKN